MRNKVKFPWLFMVCVLLLLLCVTGCSKGGDTKVEAETEEQTKESISYNVSDVAVVIKKDEEEGRISLKSKDTGSVYSVTYNGGTKFKSKYGNDILLDKVQEGMVVEAHYIEGTRKLVELLVSGEAWENAVAVNIDVDYDKKIITVGTSSYSYDDNLFIYSDGKELDIREISGMDELTVRGYGTKVLSIVVDEGHGYIRLKDEDNYVDGLIEVGDNIMTAVTEGMIIAAPEGEHTVVVSKNGVGGEISVRVKRGLETIVSLAEFEQPVERVGSINFIIGPEDADALLYIDGVQTEYTDLVRITYGNHTMMVTSNNYESVTKEITIDSTYSTINVDLSGEEETDEDETEEESESEKESETETESEIQTDVDDDTEETTTADNSSEEETTESLDEGDEVINVNSPEGAGVYFDGVYKGVAPVSFAKEAGEHVIILRKDGYETKMYTIDVVSDGEDMDISLPDMMVSE